MVQIVEMTLDRFVPKLYSRSASSCLSSRSTAPSSAPLCSWSSATTPRPESLVFGFGSGTGFMLAIVALAAIRERMRYSNVPMGLRGWASLSY